MFTQLPLTTIAFAAILLTVAAAILILIIRAPLSLKDMGTIILGSLGLTAASLFISTTDGSGSGIRTLYGWPHFFYMKWTASEDVVIHTFLPGPLGSYIIINIAFFLSATTLIAAIVRLAYYYRRLSKI